MVSELIHFLFIRSLKDKKSSDQDISDVLNACEIYCRFILHKEANSVPLKLSSRSREYLFWISNTVVKVLSQMKVKEDLVTNSPFQYLNLSRISAIGSRGSDLQPPLSPLSMSPSRRGSNSYSLSNLDASFVNMEKKGASEFMVKIDDISASVQAQSLGISLIKSAIDVYGEWLLADVDDEGVIVKHVKDWHKTMQSMSNANYANQHLFQSLCRLLVISGKSTMKYDLLVVVLSTYESIKTAHTPTCGISDLLVKTTQKIISTRSNESKVILKNFMKTLIDSITLQMSNAIELRHDKNIKDMVDEETNGWTTVVRTILNNGDSLPPFVEVILDTLSISCHNIDANVITRHVELLQMICKSCPQGNVRSIVRVMLQKYLNQGAPIVRGVDEDKLKTLIDTVSEITV